MQVGKEVKFGNQVPIFTLPPGFRPANGVIQIFASATGGSSATAALIAATNSSYEGHRLSGNVYGTKEGEVILSRITFRAQG